MSTPQEPAMPLTPTQAGPDAEIWDVVIKNYLAFCQRKAGDQAWEQFIKETIKPRQWSDFNCSKIAARLRLAKPYGFPIPVIAMIVRRSQNQVGRWLRRDGIRLYAAVPTLDGSWIPPTIVGKTGNDIVRTLADLRNAAERVERLDPVEVQLLPPGSHEQMRESTLELLARVAKLADLLTDGSTTTVSNSSEEEA